LRACTSRGSPSNSDEKPGTPLERNSGTGSILKRMAAKPSLESGGIEAAQRRV